MNEIEKEFLTKALILASSIRTNSNRFVLSAFSAFHCSSLGRSQASLSFSSSSFSSSKASGASLFTSTGSTTDKEGEEEIIL